MESLDEFRRMKQEAETLDDEAKAAKARQVQRAEELKVILAALKTKMVALITIREGGYIMERIGVEWIISSGPGSDCIVGTVMKADIDDMDTVKEMDSYIDILPFFGHPTRIYLEGVKQAMEFGNNQLEDLFEAILTAPKGTDLHSWLEQLGFKFL
jgi:hypothetical protein